GSKIPIVMALAMHEAMYENAAVLRNIKFLKNKIDFISPNMIEGKAKAAEPEDILDYVLKRFGVSLKLQNKKILMTAGPTVEYIDPIRVITNQSTGKTGVLLAADLISGGAKVTLVYGTGREKPPKGAKTIHVKTVKEMFDAVKKEMKKKFDIIILSAAASDYVPINSNKSKIKSTSKQLSIKLQKAPKIIDQIKKIQNDVFLVGFKAETNITKKILVREARKKLQESKADMIIANDVGSKRYQKNPEFNDVQIVFKDGKVIQSGWKKKNQISKFIRKHIEKQI
ncbi:MAG: bifunctional phosphopantothenoylcysteine decarboxylase/phosphopantothenate--cysteine ligase CoaBC, partial [Nitrosopumilaceae archaeon]